MDAALQTEMLHPSPSFSSLASSFKLWQKNQCVSQLVPALKCCNLTHRPMGVVEKESGFLFSSVSPPFSPQLLLIIMSKKISKDLEKPGWWSLHASIVPLALVFHQYFSRVAKHGIFIQRQFAGIEKVQQTMHSYSIMHEQTPGTYSTFLSILFIAPSLNLCRYYSSLIHVTIMCSYQISSLIYWSNNTLPQHFSDFNTNKQKRVQAQYTQKK